MSGKTYYEILNLPEGASKAEIKKSYRTLVKKYHPDVNNDPKAHQKYLEINQAYEALLDPKPKKQTTVSGPSSKTKKWQKYREQSRRKHTERKRQQEIEIKAFYKLLRKGWRRNWIRTNVLVGVIISIFMIADQYSEPTQRRVAITSFKDYSSHNSVMTIEGNFTLNDAHSSLRYHNECILFESKYLKHGLYLAYGHEGKNIYHKVLQAPRGPSFYWGYLIVLAVSLMPLLFYLFFRKNTAWFVFGHYATLIVTTPWLLYFMFMHPIMLETLKFGTLLL